MQNVHIFFWFFIIDICFGNVHFKMSIILTNRSLKSADDRFAYKNESTFEIGLTSSNTAQTELSVNTKENKRNETVNRKLSECSM